MDFHELIAASDPAVFTQSLSAWVSGISVNSVIMLVMMIFMLVGAVDKIRGNKLGYGEKFEEGFNTMGGLAMSMAGVYAAAPILSMLLGPVLKPVYGLVGASPAMFATTLLACDMGGYPLAIQLADDPAVGNFAGLILGAMMGATIVFTIPVALGIIKKEDRGYLGAGVLAGMITIPIGCIAGGLMMNTLAPEYHMGIAEILRNLIPVIFIAALIVIGLWFAPGPMIRGFNAFGTGVTAIITLLIAIAVFQQLTGIMLPVFYIMVENPADGTRGLDTGLLTCGQIAIVLIGAFPMVEWITRTFGRVLRKLGAALGMNEAASTGMVATLANNIAMFHIMSEMNPKGKLLNVAFCVSAAFLLGDHLGFTAGNNPDMIFPMIVGKLVGGVTAILVAGILAPKLLEKIDATSI